ncbi:Gliding motility-associated ABC transporter ATP-binding protein GldA [hydrothermal vent metagenome]|uniref:Gliding motility-associated ABC transporter ATP-binding protein GldA n=1 Tax=hydrothermal vent metagenome TaxID=652676 RepID=A0A3B0Z5N6_9ZZZZ
MESQTLLDAKELNIRYSNLHGVSDVSFQLKQGDVLGLLGPNGAGKTTTLKMLSGAMLASSGVIKILGETLISSKPSIRKNIGYLPEQAPLYTSMTVNEYLRWAATLRLIPEHNLNAAVEQVTSQCGLQEYRQRLIKTLSKGIRQRTGIAQAIIHKPSIILLDEPTDGLDPIQIREIRNLIIALSKNACVILSSHILPEIEACCNKVIIMNHGKIVYNGNIHALRRASGHQHLVVRFSHAICYDTLEAIACIEHVTPQSDTSYLVRCLDRDITTQAIISKSMEQGWSITEIKHYDIPLEEFFDIVTRQTHHEPNDELERTLGGI